MSEETGNNEQIQALVLQLLTRRWWMILAVACGVAVAGIAVLQLIPNRYTSEATLVVVRQQVPERYVVPNSTTDLTAALQAMKRDVLSRGRMRKIINDFALYPKQQQRGVSSDALVEFMLRDIDIQPLDETARRDFNAFRIAFVGDSPLLTQAVTSTLTTLFTNEYLRNRGEQATNTTRFLHDQVEAKKKKLEEQEQLLRDFKMRHMGELPEQQAGNLGILSGLQGQLQSTMSGVSRAEEQRVYLESLLNAYRQSASNQGIPGATLLSSTPTPVRMVSPLEAAQNDLTKLQATRASLLGRYTVDHPDVKKVERDIAQVREAIRTLKPTPSPAAAPEVAPEGRPKTAGRTTPGEADSDPAVAQLRSQLEARRAEIENLSRDERRLKAAIAQYESRLNNTPVREEQQSGIVRETEALRLEYADLQKKEQESQLATNLEKEQGGQQFRLVDPPSLPLAPSSPKRLKMSFGAVGGGLVLGIVLAVLLEMRNVSFHTEKQLSGFLDAPFVIGFPVLPTRAETQRRKWGLTLKLASGCVMVFITAMAEFYVYRRG